LRKLGLGILFPLAVLDAWPWDGEALDPRFLVEWPFPHRQYTPRWAGTEKITYILSTTAKRSANPILDFQDESTLMVTLKLARDWVVGSGARILG
jgi:hypothetical protein